jgi:WD40-like Beta Propeller Repeat
MRAAASALALLLVVASSADAQYFGRNKVEYDRFEFRIARTDHFDIYFAAKDEAAAADAAALAERWQDRLARALDYKLTERQPLVLYGSHREFSQTNIIGGSVSEGVGGVTEGLRRRIVMPFGYSLAETDHVLGHEIAHAFQYEISARYGSSMYVPLWFAEGMAEYLSVGPTHPQTTVMMRDAVASEKLPSIEELDRGRISPYRSGHAFWSWMASRFGESVLAATLKLKGRASALKRIERITGMTRDALEREWHDWLRKTFPPERAERTTQFAPVATGGRVNLAPALSPDGRRVVFLSERDRLSVDLFVADVRTGRIERKLLTTAARPEIESLQSLRSAGAWSPDARHFAFAVVRNGRAALLIFDVERGKVGRGVTLPSLGEIAGPSWAPDGNTIAFTALAAGATDLYVYGLDSNQLRGLTSDAHADLQPAWSPDGTRIAFATDRFTTDRSALTPGRLELAILELESGQVTRVAAFDANHYSPQWTPDNASLVFVTDQAPGRLARVDLASGAAGLIAELPGAVSGLTLEAPSVSVARDAGAIAASVYQRGRYDIHVAKHVPPLPRIAPIAPVAALPNVVPIAPVPFVAPESSPASVPGSVSADGNVPRAALETDEYRPRLMFDGVLQPYVATGGSAFGSFVRGGVALSFGDMLGGERFGIAVQAGTRRSDLAVQVQYLNRDSRWNWGVAAEVIPYARGRTRTLEESDGEIVVRESAREMQFHSRLAGLLSYPFGRTRRLELSAGVRHISYEQELRRREYASPGGKLVAENDSRLPGLRPAGFVESSAALVSDRAVYGPVGPILGERWRVELSPAVGSLRFTGVLGDYRRYVMPMRPYTIAARVLHSARYGPDADDPRLVPMFAGYRHLVRGYDAAAFGGCDDIGDCDRFDALFGSRLLVTNVELRVPIAGIASREVRYGAIPAEAFAFADAGVAWTGLDLPAFAGGPRRVVRSVGGGVRVNAFGMVAEIGAARPFDRARNGWNFVFNLRPSF